jgi:hypothetical protein
VSQIGTAPLHDVLALLAVHCTQCPSARQAGRVAFFDLHWVSAVHAAHAFLVGSQMGLAADVH